MDSKVEASLAFAIRNLQGWSMTRTGHARCTLQILVHFSGQGKSITIALPHDKIEIHVATVKG